MMAKHMYILLLLLLLLCVDGVLDTWGQCCAVKASVQHGKSCHVILVHMSIYTFLPVPVGHTSVGLVIGKEGNTHYATGFCETDSLG